MYYKDFDKWGIVKVETNKRKTDNVVLHHRAVWLLSVGINIGSEMDGKGLQFVRPVLIIRKINENVFLGIPISSKLSEDYFRVRIQLLNQDRMAILSQIRSFDKKRCIRFMGFISDHDYNSVIQRLISVLNL
jgi:mRNA interferase MazF